MNAFLLFWTGALVLLALVVLCTLLGWRSIRDGHMSRHRRWMTLAGGLTVFFLLAYVAKVLALGKEDLSTWSRASLIILWCHETVVSVMLLSGTTARLLARKPHLRPTWHRLAGRICAGATLLALLTASLVLAGMLSRAGIF